MPDDNNKVNNPAPSRTLPAGGIKIAEAFKSLLNGKDFSDITIEEIASASGMNSALIYKYYGDKRGLLYQLLSEGLEKYLSTLDRELKGIKGALNKLRKIVWIHLNLYMENRVLGRIMLLEARSHQSFFSSRSYQQIRQYDGIVKAIIQEGIAEGSIRDDVPVWIIRQMIMGAIEHVCMPWVVMGKELSEDRTTEHFCNVFFAGIEKR